LAEGVWVRQKQHPLIKPNRFIMGDREARRAGGTVISLMPEA